MNLMVFDFESLLTQPVSDAGCLCCGRELHGDDSQVHVNLSRYELRLLVCHRCAGQTEADDTLVFLPE